MEVRVRCLAPTMARAASIAESPWRAVGYGFMPISSNRYRRPRPRVSRFGAGSKRTRPAPAAPTRPSRALRAASTPFAAAAPSVIQRDEEAGAADTGVPEENASAVASAPAVCSTLNPYARDEVAALPNAAAKYVGHTFL